MAAEQYEALCAQCHGANGVGGAAAYTVLDEQGRFVTSVSWAAPALNNIFYRFTEEEITYVLNYGRPQSPMPAWGGPGGGPLTSQQLEELITWMGTIQLTPEEMQAEVQQGIRDAVFAIPREENPELFDAVNLDDSATAADIVAARAAQQEIYAVYNDLIPGFGDLLREEAELNDSGDASIEAIEANRTAQQEALDGYIETLAAGRHRGLRWAPLQQHRWCRVLQLRPMPHRRMVVEQRRRPCREPGAGEPDHRPRSRAAVRMVRA